MNIFTKLFATLFFFLSISISYSQEKFTRADTLRGSITPVRGWWDLNYYHLDVEIFPETKSIAGKNKVRYQVKKEYQIMQIDLQETLKIVSTTQDGVIAFAKLKSIYLILFCFYCPHFLHYFVHTGI